jgi:TfoX/Sxy family transcriptional regulator of competence genes
MDADGLKALFEPFGPVTVRRMFGGAGIYADGLCFATEADGEVFIKTDSLSQASFLDVSSRALMGHPCRRIRRMRYGTDSTRERHNDRGGRSSDTT